MSYGTFIGTYQIAFPQKNGKINGTFQRKIGTLGIYIAKNPIGTKLRLFILRFPWKI